MKKGVIQIIAASAMWGSVSIFLTLLAKSGISRIQILWLRSLISAFLLFALAALSDRAQLRIRLRDWWVFVGNGVVAMTAFSV